MKIKNLKSKMIQCARFSLLAFCLALNPPALGASPTRIVFSGEAMVVNFTNNHIGPSTILIGDTGQLPAGGGDIEITVPGTNLLDALTFDFATASTLGFDNHASSVVTITNFFLEFQTTNGATHTLSFESLEASATATCTINGPEVSGMVEIVSLRLDNTDVAVTGQ